MRLSATGIVKRYPGVTALSGVALSIGAGEVVSVVGENGAGKSTLMKILAGDVRPDEGEVRLEGEVVAFREPRDAIAAGVVLIHQELSLADMAARWKRDLFTNVIAFWEKHSLDREHGGTPFNACKGGNYKGFFHVPRALLYALRSAERQGAGVEL